MQVLYEIGNYCAPIGAPGDIGEPVITSTSEMDGEIL